MAPKINFTVGSLPKQRMRDTSPRVESVTMEFVRASLGASVAGSSKGLDLFEVHEAMGRLLRSSSGIERGNAVSEKPKKLNQTGKNG